MGQITQSDGLTVVRIRGELSVFLTASNQAHGGIRGAVGIGIANENAFTVGGIGSLQTPVTDVDWDGWIWHSFFTVASITATIADGSNAVGCVVRIPIDSKAMRKQPDNMVLYAAYEGRSEFGSVTTFLDLDCRVLVKLP